MIPQVRRSHVLRVVLQTLDEICDWVTVEADLLNSSEKRKPAGNRERLGQKKNDKLVLVQKITQIKVKQFLHPIFSESLTETYAFKSLFFTVKIIHLGV